MSMFGVPCYGVASEESEYLPFDSGHHNKNSKQQSRCITFCDSLRNHKSLLPFSVSSSKAQARTERKDIHPASQWKEVMVTLLSSSWDRVYSWTIFKKECVTQSDIIILIRIFVFVFVKYGLISTIYCWLKRCHLGTWNSCSQLNWILAELQQFLSVECWCGCGAPYHFQFRIWECKPSELGPLVKRQGYLHKCTKWSCLERHVRIL